MTLEKDLMDSGFICSNCEFFQINIWLGSEIYIGCCRDSQYFYVIIDFTFWYLEGEANDFRFTECLFKMGISVVVLLGYLRGNTMSYFFFY